MQYRAIRSHVSNYVMKASNIIHQHDNISSWIVDAKRAATNQCIDIINAEFESDPTWAIRVRGSRLKQLCGEILTLKLVEESDFQWKSADFAGSAHSAIITSAINSIYSAVHAHYRLLCIQHTTPTNDND